MYRREDGSEAQRSKGHTMKQEQVHELLYQALETELGGIQVYQTALQCAVNAELKTEWQEYLEQTERHAQILRELCATLHLDPDQETPGRRVVRHFGQSLVTAMEMALQAGKREAAQLVAAECVVAAETKDHVNWELISEVAAALKGPAGKALQAAYEQVEEEEETFVSHHWLVARTLDCLPGFACRLTSSRGGKEGQNCHRRCPCEAGTEGHAELSESKWRPRHA
jgi:rubrerythrin